MKVMKGNGFLRCDHLPAFGSGSDHETLPEEGSAGGRGEVACFVLEGDVAVCSVTCEGTVSK
ncbi:MAG: hypothetical protein Q4A40_01470 [Bacillota bacterium]|nr:hypothetical protein [Bacillota bacterium]